MNQAQHNCLLRSTEKIILSECNTFGKVGENEILFLKTKCLNCSRTGFTAGKLDPMGLNVDTDVRLSVLEDKMYSYIYSCLSF